MHAFFQEVEMPEAFRSLFFSMAWVVRMIARGNQALGSTPRLRRFRQDVDGLVERSEKDFLTSGTLDAGR
jgi:hypothetical protein